MFIGNVEVKGLARLAPMAGISNAAYRMVARECGSALTTSEEIDATGLTRKNTKTRYDIAKYLPEEKPIALQILGANAETLVPGAQWLQDQGADIIDLNMGCPVQKITKTGRGSAMMKDVPKTAKILEAMRAVLTVPFTIKIRSGWDEKHLNAVEVAKMAEDVGVDAITVHPRTRTQQFSGLSKWDMITQVVDAVNIPVTGNGDVKSMSDAKRMAAETGVESVMIGRGAMGKPWVFDETFEDLSPEEKYDYQTRVINRHTELIIELFPEHVGLIQMQKHLSWYAGGRDRVRQFRVELFGADTYEETRAIFDRYWASVDPSMSEQPNMAAV
ncbi:tRNA dihydrouridine synthase DusB [Candidatus Lucifugimonas marina]|jgi:tRNA-dihydrouridine synthase B|uniref:tRNA-dihydrouridine synthase n=1 Tax=Candidatus Lucifugimonas marina TaxID=3038979 RepID=A0AAJ5ZDZ8_9CHLR|nr:tRNA dihydrouridine synthase DusB [SAR202 cluster bacterium JH702]MDG0869742.1 tRNA dihydrouridine synthase DusB [SAR202 cluster bacterium JH639]WFG34470.1 tRNA dihydrouridine synthase DusB [SAR202 cluster bacterium JH545]WFG38399.1 tRNA dihydrouridine synthase DusB [SAR202 cluster bacterium JH1073]